MSSGSAPPMLVSFPGQTLPSEETISNHFGLHRESERQAASNSLSGEQDRAVMASWLASAATSVRSGSIDSIPPGRVPGVPSARLSRLPLTTRRPIIPSSLQFGPVLASSRARMRLLHVRAIGLCPVFSSRPTVSSGSALYMARSLPVEGTYYL
jgi:hypothetical protein